MFVDFSVVAARSSSTSKFLHRGDHLRLDVDGDVRFSKSNDYKLPSDVFNAYHEGSHDLSRAQPAVAEPGYSHRYNASHVKTWDKYRHLVYNVIREVVDDERWSSTRDVETQTDADTQTRAGSATETAAAPSQETVLRRRLGTILERKDKEFSEWRRDTTDPTETSCDGSLTHTQGTGRIRKHLASGGHGTFGQNSRSRTRQLMYECDCRLR